ncbi:MAG: N-acyl homoserine lactonase family protein [Oscillospiraceae bacterium]|nr:N-acyl homoserine lactonase family protein [Oscillospiraceae bacterium]
MADYSIWMVETARKQDDGIVIFSGFMRSAEMVDTGLSLVVLQGEGHTILIDTGVDANDPENAERLKDRGYYNVISPAAALKKLKITPEEITDIIITHAHWDHVGAAWCYPNARFYIQREELNAWREMQSLPPAYAALTRSIISSHIDYLFQLAETGRLRLLDGPCDELLPGIRIYTSPDGHTPMGQYVHIDCGAGYVATGDVTFSSDNIINDAGFLIPPGRLIATGSTQALLQTLETVCRLCEGEPARLLIPHDAAVYGRVPAVQTEDRLRTAEFRLQKTGMSRLSL